MEVQRTEIYKSSIYSISTYVTVRCTLYVKNLMVILQILAVRCTSTSLKKLRWLYGAEHRHICTI